MNEIHHQLTFLKEKVLLMWYLQMLTRDCRRLPALSMATASRFRS